MNGGNTLLLTFAFGRRDPKGEITTCAVAEWNSTTQEISFDGKVYPSEASFVAQTVQAAKDMHRWPADPRAAALEA